MSHEQRGATPQKRSDLRRLTKRRATEILLNAAQSWLRGSGCGLAERPSESQEALVKAAANRLWRDAYNFDMPRSWPL